MKTCPKCNTINPANAKFCMHCGIDLSDIPDSVEEKKVEVSQPKPNPTPNNTNSAVKPRKKKPITGKIIAWLMFFVFVAGLVEGYLLYDQHQKSILREAEIARLQEQQDSIDEVLYQRELKQEELDRQEERRIEDLTVYIQNIYSMRGKYRYNIRKYYSSSLRSAYNHWEVDSIKGPEPLLYEKYWDKPQWVVRKFKPRIVEAESPTDSSATIIVDVKFDVYNSSDDSCVGEDSHRDEFSLVYERGEWRIDDLIRDGKSCKKRYLENSTDFLNESIIRE